MSKIKTPTQRAVIIIKDRPDGTVSASIEFEPSIKGKALTPAAKIAMITAKIVQDLIQKKEAV